VAAATGEEPWSLAIALVEAFGRPDPPVEILATDVNAEALEVARRGEYPARAAAAVGAPRWARCFAPVNTERWRIAESCRRLVAFRQLNLAWHVWPVTGAFDVVFCRNVIMYLERDFRHTVLERIRRLLAPGGLLIMHPAEHPGRTTSALACVADGIYERRNPDLPETEPDGARVPLLRRRLRSAGELVNGSALSAARP
jgi:chemotaxis protein methyltransferase CheR